MKNFESLPINNPIVMSAENLPADESFEIDFETLHRVLVNEKGEIVKRYERP